VAILSSGKQRLGWVKTLLIVSRSIWMVFEGITLEMRFVLAV